MIIYLSKSILALHFLTFDAEFTRVQNIDGPSSMLFGALLNNGILFKMCSTTKLNILIKISLGSHITEIKYFEREIRESVFLMFFPIPAVTALIPNGIYS